MEKRATQDLIYSQGVSMHSSFEGVLFM